MSVGDNKAASIDVGVELLLRDAAVDAGEAALDGGFGEGFGEDAEVRLTFGAGSSSLGVPDFWLAKVLLVPLARTPTSGEAADGCDKSSDSAMLVAVRLTELARATLSALVKLLALLP